MNLRFDKNPVFFTSQGGEEIIHILDDVDLRYFKVNIYTERGFVDEDMEIIYETDEETGDKYWIGSCNSWVTVTLFGREVKITVSSCETDVVRKCVLFIDDYAYRYHGEITVTQSGN